MPTHSLTHTITAKTIADLWARLKAQGPRVHCITNSVVQNLTANTLLAVGAVPSMSTDAAEIVDFSRSAHALLVNLGTLDAERRHAIATAIPVMAESGKAWVLDPVMIDSAPHRLAYARDLLALTPAIIRANQAEMDALGPHHGVLAISGVKDSVKTTQGRITRPCLWQHDHRRRLCAFGHHGGTDRCERQSRSGSSHRLCCLRHCAGYCGARGRGAGQFCRAPAR